MCKEPVANCHGLLLYKNPRIERPECGTMNRGGGYEKTNSNNGSNKFNNIRL